eukprot:scaffold82151_cov60-Phaeocystis_antarctica.AAC.2
MLEVRVAFFWGECLSCWGNVAQVLVAWSFIVWPRSCGRREQMPASVRCSCGRPGTPREVQKPWGKGGEALVRHETGACETGALRAGGGGHRTADAELTYITDAWSPELTILIGICFDESQGGV